MEAINKKMAYNFFSTICLVVILYILLRIILLSSYIEFDIRHIQTNLERVKNLISHNINILDEDTNDWASWDDAYDFIEEANETFIEKNLIEETFKTLRINLMMFINNSGKNVFAKSFDLMEEKWKQVPESINRYFKGEKSLLNHLDIKSNIVGFVLIDELPMIISSRPILTSRDKGPIRGTLIMGRYLDANEANRLGKILSLTVKIQQLNHEKLPNDFSEAYNFLSQGKPFFFKQGSKDLISGYCIMNDIFEKPAFLIKLDLHREFSIQGEKTLDYCFFLIIVTGFVFSIVNMIIFDKKALSRLLDFARKSIKAYER